MLNSLKKAISNFIKKLAAESEKSFGNERLDCCTLDRPKSNENDK
ncbi:MAG: LDCC motif putative metal-binding protein [Bacillota bacterium]